MFSKKFQAFKFRSQEAQIYFVNISVSNTNFPFLLPVHTWEIILENNKNFFS